MDNELQFASDLYHGAAGYYDSYRLPYPDAMIGYVTDQAAVSGQGRLLDLACGTGQLTFPVRRWFFGVWTVDREPDMVEAVRAKADAETLDAAPGYFELAVNRRAAQVPWLHSGGTGGDHGRDPWPGLPD